MLIFFTHFHFRFLNLKLEMTHFHFKSLCHSFNIFYTLLGFSLLLALACAQEESESQKANVEQQNSMFNMEKKAIDKMRYYGGLGKRQAEFAE